MNLESMYRHLLDSMNGDLFHSIHRAPVSPHTWKPRSGARIKPRRKPGGGIRER
jgi:hypothetical protein